MDCDVLVVGLGPVGLTLCALLRADGVKVIGVDRDPALSALPRAVVLDDDALRVLQAVGVRPPGVVHARALLRLADGRAVTLQRIPERTALGQPGLLSLHQPDLECALEATVGEVERGRELIGLVQEATQIRARVRGPDGDDHVIRARWLVGCDGARSAVRRLAGITLRGSTAAEPWTVVDGRPRGPVAASRDVEFIGDPRGPAVTLPLGENLRRWEFLGDRLAEMPGPLVRWCADVEIVRAAVYIFHARIAERWWSGRVLLAGDAAHLMPPFAGQGLCSGLRDAANLAWRLRAVLDGAPESVLAGYERERAPHVRAMTRYARFIGAIVQTRRPRVALVRDTALLGLDAVPGLGAWLQAGALKPRLPREPVPQPIVRDAAGARRPLDELLGRRWTLLARASVPAQAAGALRAAGAVPTVLALGRDLESLELDRWLAGHRAGGALIRPDRVVESFLDAR